MATLDEYKAITGQEPPAGQTPATELGDGGCHRIYKGRHHTEVVGGWRSYVTASEALVNLQTLGGRFEYILETNHHWVTNRGVTTCQRCGDKRTLFTNSRSGMEWPA